MRSGWAWDHRLSAGLPPLPRVVTSTQCLTAGPGTWGHSAHAHCINKQGGGAGVPVCLLRGRASVESPGHLTGNNLRKLKFCSPVSGNHCPVCHHDPMSPDSMCDPRKGTSQSHGSLLPPLLLVNFQNSGPGDRLLPGKFPGTPQFTEGLGDGFRNTISIGG